MDGNGSADLRCVSQVGPQHERDVSVQNSSENELAAMIETEATMFASKEFGSLRTAKHPSNVVWREKVCQWCYDVVDHLDVSRDVVYVAMNILDRFYALEACSQLARNEKVYELAAMTGLFLAIRLSGKARVAACDMTRMSRRGIHAQDLLKMGKSMLEKLRWDHRLSTPSSFVDAFVALLTPSVGEIAKRAVLDTACYLVEVSVCDSFFSGIPASQVAYAAVVNAASTRLRDQQRQDLHNAIHAMTGIQGDASEIRALRSRLLHIYSQSEAGNTPVAHVIPEAETEENIPTLSKPVPRRCVSDNDLPLAFAPAIKSESLASQAICESCLSPLTDCHDTAPNKRPVSPPPNPGEDPIINKRARTC